MDRSLIELLKKYCADSTVDMPMDKLTSFKAGGTAALFLRPDTEEMKKLILVLSKIGQRYVVIGRGSNVLVSDRGYDGVVIQAGKKMSEISVKDNVITAGAGASNSSVAKEALSASLSGFEFASGIPGSIGGAVFMNAGAYDGEMKDIILSVTSVNADGELSVRSAEECAFSYRKSIFSERCEDGCSPEEVILSCEIALTKGSADEIEAKMQSLQERRREKQPLDYPSAGSTFKRPEGYFAGKLIEDAGLKGFSKGGAAVSEKHAGFIINKDNATAAEIYALIQLVREKVFENSGVELEPEVRFIGNFS